MARHQDNTKRFFNKNRVAATLWLVQEKGIANRFDEKFAFSAD